MSLCLQRLLASSRPLVLFRQGTASYSQGKVQSDEFGIPTQPTWSVNELLSSYPSPKLEAATLNRLYELSALIPPEQGSVEYDNVKKGLEEMVRLVEAVKQVDTGGVQPRGRGEKEDADRVGVVEKSWGKHGQELLEYAPRVANGLYVIDAERRR